MKWRQFILAVVLPAVLVLPLQGGIFFGKKKPPDPAKRVPELIVILKTSSNERQRSAAAAELRHYDTTAFPEIVPVLTETALSDPKAGVRIDAVESLAHIRPISQQAGQALEQVLARDSNLRVRLAARSSLWQYHLSGYRGVPVAPPAATTVPASATVTSSSLTQPVFPTNAEPPLAPAAPPVPAVIIPSPGPLAPLPTGRAPQRLPTGPPQPSVTPIAPPQLETPPVDGPDLGIPHS